MSKCLNSLLNWRKKPKKEIDWPSCEPMENGHACDIDPENCNYTREDRLKIGGFILPMIDLGKIRQHAKNLGGICAPACEECCIVTSRHGLYTGCESCPIQEKQARINKRARELQELASALEEGQELHITKTGIEMGIVTAWVKFTQKKIEDEEAKYTRLQAWTDFETMLGKLQAGIGGLIEVIYQGNDEGWWPKK